MNTRTAAILGSPIITPDRLPGLAAWYSADYGVLSQVGGGTAFASASSQNVSNDSFSFVSDKTASFSACAWVKSASPNVGYIMSTRLGANGFLSFRHNGGLEVFAGLTSVLTTGSPISSSWSLWSISYSSTTGIVSVFQNGSLVGTVDVSSSSITGTSRIAFGSRDASGLPFQGEMDEVAIWNRAITLSDVQWLYNSGAGRTYSEADAAMKTNLVSWWSMNAPASGNWLDQHGTNHLTPSASRPTATEGVTFNAATDGQTVRRWLDRGPNGWHLDQATLLNQPTLTGGKVVYNGTASKMTATSHSTSPYSHYFAATVTRVSSTSTWNYICDGATTDRSAILSGVSSGDDVTNPKNTSFAIGRSPYLIAVGKYTEYGTRLIMVGGVVNGASSRFRVGDYTLAGNAGTLHPNGAFIMGAAGNGSSYAGLSTCEYCMFTGALSIDNEEKLAKYFAKRWGVLK